MEGLGQVHLKAEGAPIHPDDTLADLSPEQYQRQLGAYNTYHGIGKPMDLEAVYDILCIAERQGLAIDEPEGSRYIILSETLVKRMMESLRDELERRNR